jgi:hypothetical protein
MHMWRSVAALVVVACLFSAAAGADLTKVDRSLKKEPAYESKSPKYCLLVIGPEARTRAWLVLDGDTLYVDRNGNGDLTDAGERVEGAIAQNESKKVADFNAGEVLDADGKTKHGEVKVKLLALKNGKAAHTFVSGTLAGGQIFAVRMDLLRDQRFADRPQDAPIIHFGGALQVRLFFADREELVPGEELFARVGTPGLGKGTFADLAHQTVPADLHPVAVIEFPNRDLGGPAVKLNLVLKERC